MSDTTSAEPDDSVTDYAEEYDLDWLGETSAPSAMGDPKQIGLYGKIGSGKGHPYGTPILTPHGWLPVEELAQGDTIIGSDGKWCTVYGVYDKGLLQTYRVTLSDGSWVDVDEDHLWFVKNKKGNQHVLSTRQILDKWNEVYSKYNLEIPPAPACHLLENSGLPIPPYALGCLLADGHLHGASIQWTKNNSAVAKAMAESLAEGGFSLRETTHPNATARQWKIGHADNGHHHSVIRRTLIDMGLNVPSKDKFIPDKYFASSLEQRTALLAGLFDGDGSIDHRGNAKYSTTSKRLGEDVLRLCWSLGVAAHIQRNRYDKTWVVCIQDKYTPFLASDHLSNPRFRPHDSRYGARRIVSVEANEGLKEVRCIAVTAHDQLYVTKDYIVTHNSYLAASICEVEGYYPALIIDTEESTYGTVSGFPDDRLVIKHVATVAEFNKVVTNLLNKPHPFKTVIVDTMGNALDRKEWEIMSNPPKSQSGADDTNKAWGMLYQYAKKIMDGLRSADFATILIFHEKEETDAVGNRFSRIWINGAAKKYVPSKPDLFGLLECESDDDAGVETRTIYFGNDASRATKTRFANAGLPLKMTNPTMAKIIGKIRESKEV